MRPGDIACVVLLALQMGCSQEPSSDGREDVGDDGLAGNADDGALHDVAASSLCVTSGHVDELANGRLKVDVGTMRGVVAGNRGRAAELAFTYPGPSDEDTPLANGELRRQIGLKLRARDSCNVLYVMWHIEPTPGIVVQMKHNPGLSTHAECGDLGYVTVASFAAPNVRPGDSHTLRADLEGEMLTVVADGAVAWKGNVPREASTFDGPAGVRTDNGKFDFRLRVAGRAERTADCATGGGTR